MFEPYTHLLRHATTILVSQNILATQHQLIFLPYILELLSINRSGCKKGCIAKSDALKITKIFLENEFIYKIQIDGQKGFRPESSLRRSIRNH